MILYLNEEHGYFHQPTWWINFLNVVHKNYRCNELERGEWITIVADTFSQWGAMVIMKDDDYHAIEFEDDGKATWFLLRWS